MIRWARTKGTSQGGIETTQFGLLSALVIVGESSQKGLSAGCYDGDGRMKLYESCRCLSGTPYRSGVSRLSRDEAIVEAIVLDNPGPRRCSRFGAIQARAGKDSSITNSANFIVSALEW